MKNIELAKTTLKDEGQSIVIVKDQAVIYKSKDSGIKPLLFAYQNNLEDLEGATVADKVIGKAAALLLAEAKISELYAELISEPALELLERAEIDVTYGLKVTNILNRDQTDLCLMEKLAKDENMAEPLVEKIVDFFKNIKL